MKEPSAKYLTQSGYKQTEVGMIPEDWTIARLGDLFEITSSKRVFQSEWKSEGIPFFRAREIAILAERGSVDNELFISKQMYDAFRRAYGAPQVGDLLVTGVGTLGKVYVVPDDREFYFKDGNIIWFRTAGAICPAYLQQLYLTPVVIKQITNSSAGTTVGTYTISNAKKTVIPLPTKVEQEAIASALSDVDALIESLGQLLVKKRHVKKGAMQELLTGKRRLPGFSGEWEVKALGELFTFSGGLSASRDQLSAEGHCYLHYGDIHLSTKSFIDVRGEFQNIPKLKVPLNKIAAKSLLEDGDVVFVDASEDEEGASKHVVVVNPDNIPFISGLHTIVAKGLSAELDHRYRRYCFQAHAVRAQFRFFAVGTKVSGISKTNIAKVTLPVPSVAEQSAIATILADMDTEIDSLEMKLAKACDIKKGMMQELLVGRIRLV